jgi:predicted nucleic acid-binding protein
MARRVLDTNILLSFWWKRFKERPQERAEADARHWGRELIEAYQSNAILTPIAIELVMRSTNDVELKLRRAFLEAFDIVDQGRISREDWAAARRYAERIPPSGQHRQLGDCLILALAARLSLDVISADRGLIRARGNQRKWRR